MRLEKSRSNDADTKYGCRQPGICGIGENTGSAAGRNDKHRFLGIRKAIAVLAAAAIFIPAFGEEGVVWAQDKTEDLRQADTDYAAAGTVYEIYKAFKDGTEITDECVDPEFGTQGGER